MALAYILGHNLRISLEGTPIAHAKSCKITYDKDVKKINHKDINPGSEGGGYSEATGGIKSAKGTCSAYIYKSGSSLGTIKTAWAADTVLEMTFSTDVTGEFKDTFDIILTNMELTAEDESVAEYSVSFESVGAITFGTSS